VRGIAVSAHGPSSCWARTPCSSRSLRRAGVDRPLATSSPSCSLLPGRAHGTVAFGLLVMAGVASFGPPASRLRYETWWRCTFTPTWRSPSPFSHSWLTASRSSGIRWPGLFWIVDLGFDRGRRARVPLGSSSLAHCLPSAPVAEVREEGPGVVSVICAGRHLERLPIVGGQFLQWRFLHSDLWWQAHPYSISALRGLLPPRDCQVARRLLQVRGEHPGRHSGWPSKVPTARSRHIRAAATRSCSSRRRRGHSDARHPRGLARRGLTSWSCCARHTEGRDIPP